MRRTFLLLSVMLASGCATLSGWRPTIDAKMDSHPESIDRDLDECQTLAKQASGGAGKTAARDGAIGAAGGAAVGALLGAISGNAGSSAAVGAVIGGAGGTAEGGLSADQQYKTSYIKCMEGRGHRVIN